MYPNNNKNLISGINSFLNKQFGVPLPSTTSYGIKKPTQSYAPNMSYATGYIPNQYVKNMSYTPGSGPNMSYANPAATNTKAPVIAPPTEKPKLPPAGNQYVQDAYDKITGARTAYGASLGLPDMLGGKPVNQGDQTSANQFGGASIETVAPPKTQESPYAAYLKSMNEDYARLAGIQNESEAKELEARRMYEETLDKPGGYVSGAKEAAALSSRRYNQELADLALRESAAARTAGVSQAAYQQAYSENQPVEVGGVLYQKGADGQYIPLTGTGSADGFTLGKDQVRYDAQGNVIAGNVSGGGNLSDSPYVSAYADAVLNGKTKLENIPEEFRGAVAQAISGQSVTPETSPYLANLAVQGRQAVGGLLEIAQANPGIFGKSAAAPIPGMLRSDAYRNYEAQLDYLKGNIIPAALSAMREASKTGGALGQVSDREGAWLASSLGALSMTQSSDAVVKQLKLIDESMKRWEDAVNKYGQESGGEGGLYDW